MNPASQNPDSIQDYRKSITDHFRRSPSFNDFLTAVTNTTKTGNPPSLSGLVPTAVTLLLGSYFKELSIDKISIEPRPQSLIHILPNDIEALNSYNSLRFFFPDLVDVILYPSLSELPGKLTPLPADESHARHTLLHRWNHNPNQTTLIVTSLKAALEKIPSPKNIKPSQPNHTITVGDNQPLMRWGKILEDLGYRRNHEVSSPGEYGIKNGVLDIYPPKEGHPHRIYFWDEEVEMIKPFNPHTQQLLPSKNSQAIQTLAISSPRLSDYHSYDNGSYLDKIFRGKKGKEKDEMKTYWRSSQEFSWALLEPFLDNEQWEWTSLLQVAPYPQIIIDQSSISEEVFNKITDPYRRHSEWNKGGFFAPPEKRFFPLTSLTEHSPITIHRHPLENNNIHFPAKQPLGFKKDVDKCREYLQAEKDRGKRIFLFTSNHMSGKKLCNFFKSLDPLLHDGEENPSKEIDNPFTVICHPISGGMDYSNLILITDFELFHKKPKTIIGEKTVTEVLEYFSDLKENDYVVHINHGIGRYLGLERINNGDSEKDYLKLLYHGGDKVFVPVEQMNLVQRYIGNRGQPPRMDSLGGKSWDKIKNRVRKQLENITRELITLYRERRDQHRVPCQQDDYFQDLFESGFPYQETEDQIRASEEIKRDLEKNTVMERLLCGDVGFGKTEVAMRAIFKVVFSGRQAAVLVPTTILSMQHFQRFEERFQDFPVTIRVLNRFKEKMERDEILRDTAAGKVEILIGTHAILSQKIKFKKLGLLVIDEEQKFGVKQKEKIKSLYPHIDTLSLSATPIPRTLHLSLSSIRSLSVLNTPPQNRHAVKTFVLKWDITVIKEAVERERARSGQIFFIHNKVSSLATVAALLKKEMPEIRLAVAHGQMAGRDLEAVMNDFVHHRYDILVSTSIIESGMDLSRVNTLIVNNADHFGLTQLYQLRGRVGRSDREAFSYFFLPSDRSIGEDALKRLDALITHTELGAGFKIAMSDLEIRGPGNILGAEQSGNIMAIGFELYTRLLNESIRDWQEGTTSKESDYFPGTLLELKYEGFIPHNYIPEDRQKIAVYKKIAAIENPEGIERVRGEIEAQYGRTIPVIDRLLRIAEIRALGNEMRIFSIREIPEYYEVTLYQGSRVNRERLLRMVMTHSLEAMPERPELFRISTFNKKAGRPFPFEERIGQLEGLLMKLKEKDG